MVSDEVWTWELSD